MRKKLVHVLAPALVALALAVPCRAAQEGPSLRLGFGDQRVDSPSAVLDLGRMAAGDLRDFEIEVTLVGADAPREVAAHVYGLGLSGHWRDGQNRVSLRPGESRIFDLRVALRSESEASLFTVLWTDSEDRPLGQLTLDYQLFGKDRLVETAESGTMTSPSGKDWSRWFYTCIGPPPTGYVYVSASFRVTSRHNRRCGKWVKCRPAEQTDEKRCWRFQIQGHDGGTWDPDETRKGNGVVTATYRLDRSPPVLIPF